MASLLYASDAVALRQDPGNNLIEDNHPETSDTVGRDKSSIQSKHYTARLASICLLSLEMFANIGAPFSIYKSALQGGEAVFRSIAAQFGPHLLSDLSCLTNLISNGLHQDAAENPDSQETIQSLQVLEVIGPHLLPELRPQLVLWLDQLATCFWQTQTSIRLLAARTAAAIASSSPAEFLPLLLR